MGGKMSRNKGRLFENLIRKYFEGRSAWDPHRWQVTHRSAARQPGADIVVWAGNRAELVVECKNDRNLSMAAMWRQAAEQSFKRGGGHPLVVHKRHGETGAEEQWVTMTLEAFTDLIDDLTGA